MMKHTSPLLSQGTHSPASHHWAPNSHSSSDWHFPSESGESTSCGTKTQSGRKVLDLSDLLFYTGSGCRGGDFLR